MKNKLIYLGLFSVLSIGAFVEGSKKVTICHLPPGNPENVQTITVSKAAALTHIVLHGDSYGKCGEVEPAK